MAIEDPGLLQEVRDLRDLRQKKREGCYPFPWLVVFLVFLVVFWLLLFFEFVSQHLLLFLDLSFSG
ncbi:hypothetical protein [Sphaerospermopsis sp. FACHB-1194]|uniref:hypothetical protein n=1 Tax=Sphaerospermopsis sp. FACHB-1194 TaxID=2692862 RepID=UPI001680095C